MQRHIPAGADVVITDLTAGTALFSLQGPNSRAVLAALSAVDMSAAAQPHLTVFEVDVAGVPVLLARVTYVGELGFELYVPADSAGGLCDALLDAGRPLGLRLAGAAAMESLRTEKGNLEYAVDVDNTDTPMQVGLSFWWPGTSRAASSGTTRWLR